VATHDVTQGQLVPKSCSILKLFIYKKEPGLHLLKVNMIAILAGIVNNRILYAKSSVGTSLKRSTTG
jgi:hypothetical protein